MFPHVTVKKKQKHHAVLNPNTSTEKCSERSIIFYTEK